MKKGQDAGMPGSRRDLLRFAAYICVILVVTFGIVHFVGQRTVVSGISMEETLGDGDNLIIDKLSYHFANPQRFDIVIFPYRFEKNTFYIKRIIGLPGETVYIGEDGTIYIDGTILEESYGSEQIVDPGLAKEPIMLGDDEYFVLGDNRNESEDSRFSDVGNVTRGEIMGKAVFRLYPFDKVGGI